MIAGTVGTVCPHCDVDVPGTARFCPSCGAPVAPAESPVRKTVTLVFCDLVGSTAIGERLDPESLRSLTADFFQVARAAVHRHGGTVEKFIGDAVVAVFGVPEVREDDPLRAVRAAGEIAAELTMPDVQARTGGVHLAVRTAVNTGGVVVGRAQAGGSFATGDAVNTAARLEQAAAPGEVLLAASTWSLVRDAVEVGPAVSLAVKGKSDPLVAYPLHRVLPVDRGRTPRTGGAFVGRERPLQVLREALARVVQNDRAELVTVLGAAGMGKTTLVEHFLQDPAPGRPAVGIRVLRGRCPSYGRGSTFWPVAQLVREAAGLAAPADVGQVRRSLGAVLAGAPDTGQVVEDLLPVLDVETDSVDQTRTFFAVRRFLEHLAAAGPLVVGLEDVHWADSLLVDLLEEVRQELPDVPILWVVQARPEFFEAAPSWGAGSITSTTVSLEPLDGPQTGRLLATSLGSGLPGEVVRAVDARAGGNPLFVTELGDHLAETGVLRRVAGGWTVRGSLDAVPMPPSVQAVLAARLDRLSATERSMLGRLSVVGANLGLEDARAVAERASDAETVLVGLTRRDLLRRLRSGGVDAWTFRHVLVREAAYEALPKAVRADVHERTAGRLLSGVPGRPASDGGSERTVVAAHHLGQALRLQQELSAAPDVLAALRERTVTALTAAADRCEEIDDSAAAADLLERSCRLLAPTDRRRRHLLYRLARFQFDLVRVNAARTTYDELVATGVAEGNGSAAHDELEDASMQVLQTMIALDVGEDVDPEPAAALATRVADLARAAGDRDRLLVALMLSRDVATLSDRWEQAFDVLAELAEERAVSIRRLVTSRSTGYVWGARPVAVGLAYLESVTADPALPPQARLTAEAAEAVLRAWDGQLDAARSLVATCQDDMARLGRASDTILFYYLSEAHLSCGDDGTALDLLVRGTAAAEADGSFAVASSMLGLQAAILLEAGRDAEAVAALERSEPWTSPHDAVSVVTNAACRAVLAARSGDAATAAAQTSLAVAVVDRTDDLVLQGRVRWWLALAAGQQGDRAAARELLAQARECFARKGHRPMATQVDRRLAAWPAG